MCSSGARHNSARPRHKSARALCLHLPDSPAPAPAPAPAGASADAGAGAGASRRRRRRRLRAAAAGARAGAGAGAGSGRGLSMGYAAMRHVGHVPLGLGLLDGAVYVLGAGYATPRESKPKGHSLGLRGPENDETMGLGHGGWAGGAAH